MRISARLMPILPDPASCLFEARECVRRARAAAAIRIAASRRRAALMVVRSRERARRRGFAAGQAEGRQAISEALRKLSHCHEETIRAAENEAIRLALGVAEEVIAQRVELGQSGLAERVRGAIASLAVRHPLLIECHSQDLDPARAELGRDIPGAEFSASPVLSRGTVRISNGAGHLLLDWRRHLDAVNRAVLERAGICTEERNHA